MNKRILEDSEYTFDATARTVKFTEAIELNHILLITNISTNAIIYNFACDGYGGTLSSNTLTLEYDTSSMSTTDLLSVIVYKEDPLDETNNLLSIIRRQTSLQEAIYEEMVEQTKYLRKIYSPE